MGTTTRKVMLTRPNYTRKPVLSTRGTSGTPGATHAYAHDVREHTHAQPRTTRSETLVERFRVASSAHADTAARTHARDASTGTHADARELLNHLTVEQRQELLDKLLADKLLDAAAAGNDREVTMWTEAVHRALVAVVGSMGGAVAGPGLIRKVLRVGTAWEPVATFMRASKLQEMPVVERQQAYNLLAELLVRYARTAARRSGAPLSPKFLANCTQNVAGVFENAFPGYVEAGLARMVVRAHA